MLNGDSVGAVEEGSAVGVMVGEDVEGTVSEVAFFDDKNPAISMSFFWASSNSFL